MFKEFFLGRILETIRKTLPSFVWSSTLRLLPVSLILSILDVFGLVMVIPVIQMILEPDKIEENAFLKSLYAILQSPGQTQFILMLLGVVVIFFTLKNGLIYLASSQQASIAYDVSARLTVLQFERYLYQPFESHVKDNSSDLLRKIIEIPFNFTNGIMLPVVLLINEIVIAFIIIVAICLFNIQLFLSIILLVSPFLFLYIKVYKKLLTQSSNRRDSGHTDMFIKGRQSMEGFREMKVFDRFEFFVPQFKDSVFRFSKAIGQVYHLNAFSPKIIEILAITCVFGIFGVGIMLNYDLASLATFLAAFAIASYRLIPSINKIILCYNNIRSSEFVFKHFDSRLKHYSDKPANSEARPEAMAFDEEIRFENIVFSFSKKDALLNGINISIKKGEIIGIIGKSGSGKSTLLNIMLGLYKPMSGGIYVDDVAINEALMRSWHRTISLVPQDPILIEGSIGENIAFGIPVDKVDASRLSNAVQYSGLGEFLDGLPDGLATRIGQKSLNISGGQKQRIAIARALYHDGKVLIFDEATSSLDAETEKLLAESVKDLSNQRYTIIIVAHRMEILKHCDKIFNLHQGQVSEPLKYSDVV